MAGADLEEPEGEPRQGFGTQLRGSFQCGVNHMPWEGPLTFILRIPYTVNIRCSSIRGCWAFGNRELNTYWFISVIQLYLHSGDTDSELTPK